MGDSLDMQELQGKPLGTRLRHYWRMTGPGYMQSAMTLGGGSVASCAILGSLLGYELLWVQPVGMLLGFFFLAAIAKQTCQTGERPYEVFWKRLHPILALLWGGSAFVATIIWHVPQYSLTANGVVALTGRVGLDLDPTAGRIVIGAVVVGLATWVVYLYNSGARGLRIYERAVKSLVWLIVFAFFLVVLFTGVDFGRFFLGISGVAFLRDVFDADGLDPRAIAPIVGGISAAVGINMVFLYPYSLLRKGWGKQHREVAYFDLVTGMALPFILATGFMLLAVSNTIGPAAGDVAESTVRDIRDIVPALKPTFGKLVGVDRGEGVALLVIGFGMTAIGFSTIITHMLACGFIGCEMFGMRDNDKARWWFSMVPAVGVVGVAVAAPLPIAITASTLAAPLMPITVVCFLVLMNRSDYMGEARPRAGKKLFWNVALSLVAIALTVNAWFALTANWDKLQRHLTPPVAEAPPADSVPATPPAPDPGNR